MRRGTNFLDHPSEGWPDPGWLRPYFLTPEGRQQAFGDQEEWWFDIDGLEGTENLPSGKGRIDLDFILESHPHHGIMLSWRIWGGGRKECKVSLGHPLRMDRWLRNGQGDRRPVGLFVPYEAAWL